MLGAAVLGAAASSSASNRASKAQTGAADRATQLQQNQYNTALAGQAPGEEAGFGALSQLASGLGMAPLSAPTSQNAFDARAYLAANPDVAANSYFAQNPYEHYQRYGQGEGREFTRTEGSQRTVDAAQANQGSASGTPRGDFNRDFTLADFQKDPGYDFRMSQGLGAVQGSAAARGSLMSGSTLKALSDYGSNMASSEYGKAYDRFNNDRAQRFNRLSTVAGIGQTATNNVGTTGANFTNAASSNALGAGNAAAAGGVGVANAFNNGASSLQSLYQLNRIFPGQSAAKAAPSSSMPTNYNSVYSDVSYRPAYIGGGEGE